MGRGCEGGLTLVQHLEHGRIDTMPSTSIELDSVAGIVIRWPHLTNMAAYKDEFPKGFISDLKLHEISQLPLALQALRC